MNWKLFIARRIYKSNEGGKEVSKPAVRIAMVGIAIGLAVMIVSVAVVIGFKHQVRDKVAGLGADVLVTSMEAAQSYQATPIECGDSLIAKLHDVPNVSHIQRYSTKPGMIMTKHDFQGMVLKGIGQEYDVTYLNNHIVEGNIPEFTDSVASNKVLISKDIADKLSLKVGDKLDTYYLENNIRARRMTVCGIYQTNFSAFDGLFLVTDLYTVSKLNNWAKGDRISGIEISISDPKQAEQVEEDLYTLFNNKTDSYGVEYYPRTVEEVYPQIFAWLDLLDVNVWVILILMTGVAGFTMISGLLIIILERTNMIGVLKALGADNTSIRKVFLSFSVFLIGRGMLAGNAIALTFYVLQRYFHVIKLDPATYYLDSVPVEISVWIWLLLNICTLIVAVLMLVGPSYLVSRIHPAKSMRYD